MPRPEPSRQERKRRLFAAALVVGTLLVAWSVLLLLVAPRAPVPMSAPGSDGPHAATGMAEPYSGMKAETGMGSQEPYAIGEAVEPPREMRETPPGSSGHSAAGPPEEEEAYADLIDTVAHGGKRYRKVPLAYRVPDELRWGEGTRFSLIVAGSDLERAMGILEAGPPGRTEVERPLLGSRVRARLTGDPSEVEITPDPESQGDRLVSPVANTTWVWWVTPKTTDEVELTLSVYNVVQVAGQAELVEAPTYTNTFPVRVGPAQRLGLWLGSLNRWVLGLGAFATAASVLLATPLGKALWRPLRSALAKGGNS